MNFFPSGVLSHVSALQRSAYNRTCTVQALQASEPRPGQHVEAWVDVASGIPCSVHPRAGREIVRAGHLDPEQPVLVKMDWRQDVTAEGRLVLDDGTVLDIVGPPEDVQGARRWLHVVCRHIAVPAAEGA